MPRRHREPGRGPGEVGRRGHASIRTLRGICTATLYVPLTVFNVAGETWLFVYGLGVVLELILLGLIARFAWTWARPATSLDREAFRSHQQA